jgi:hypothetical protein
MRISFQNGYSSLIYVAIALHDANCDPPWASEGWCSASGGLRPVFGK